MARAAVTLPSWPRIGRMPTALARRRAARRRAARRRAARRRAARRRAARRRARARARVTSPVATPRHARIVVAAPLAPPAPRSLSPACPECHVAVQASLPPSLPPLALPPLLAPLLAPLLPPGRPPGGRVRDGPPTKEARAAGRGVLVPLACVAAPACERRT